MFQVKLVGLDLKKPELPVLVYKSMTCTGKHLTFLFLYNDFGCDYKMMRNSFGFYYNCCKLLIIFYYGKLVISAVTQRLILP